MDLKPSNYNISTNASLEDIKKVLTSDMKDWGEM
jgi:hypothetical protein